MTKFLDEYLRLKNLYPNHLLFFRVGSFYELYFDDVKLVASGLNITVNHKKINNQQIPSCGFPAKSLTVFSNKLLQLGFKIAISEQPKEEPKEKLLDQKNLKKVIRKINRIITPGTATEDGFVDEKENILLAVFFDKTKLHICFGDIFLGNFYVDEIYPSQINQYLDSVKPSEILLVDKNLIDKKFYPQATIYLPNHNFRIDRQIFKIFSKYQNLALQAIFNYIATIHNPKILQHFDVKQFWQEHFLKISAKTRQNLQLAEVIKNIDKTNCSIGKRFLQKTINQPLVKVAKINDRLDGVDFLLSQNDVLEKLIKQLKNLPDCEKIIGKMAITQNSKINDFVDILESLQIFVKIAEILFWQNNAKKLPSIFMLISKELLADFELINFLKSAIHCGDLKIKAEFNAKLGNWQSLQHEIITKINNLEKKYCHISQIKNLKIEFSFLLGFYFEINREKATKIDIPDDWQLLQNLNNSIRFSSATLKNYQLQNADLELKIKALELEILQKLTTKTLQFFNKIKDACKAIGLLDLLVSFAILTKINCYVRPIINNQNKIRIIDGVHPIFKQFVANDCLFDDNKIWLITGANMAGKSTFLRQNALIILLAQAGCFVPAKQAQIGVRKQIFSKMLINDNLLKNQSSFMVEMIEIAEILNNANSSSLVIIDELCQTTNSSEGQIIAFNIIKYLLENNQSLALISSHNFDLANQCQNLTNIICKKFFDLHQIKNGIAKESSAMAIAQKAGLPPKIFNQNL